MQIKLTQFEKRPLSKTYSNKTKLVTAFLGLMLMSSGIPDPYAADALTVIGKIPLAGVAGRFDHFSIDSSGQRLFVAGLGNNTVEVLDLKSKQRITSIRGIRKPQGVVFVPELNRIGVACGEDRAFKWFNSENYKLAQTIPALDDADNVRFDAVNQRLYVGYGEGALAVMSAQRMKKEAEIKLSGHPESFQLEQQGERIFVNVPDSGHIAVVHRSNGTIATTWPMTKFRSNFPMALDEENHRLFVGCRQPARLVLFDTENGKQIGDIEISGDTDDLFYDGKRHRVYASCGEGSVDLIDAPPRDALKRLAKLPTRAGARTSFFSKDLDELYVALPGRGGDSAEIRIFHPEQP